MTRHEIRFYSHCLERNINLISYGDYGLPMIFFAPQDGDCRAYEGCGMIDNIKDYIDSGKIQVFTVDSVDKDSISDLGGDKEHRTYILEQFYYFVTDELVPFVKRECPYRPDPFLFGVSAGANVAAIQFLRRPELYSGMLSLSSVLDVKSYFFQGWCDKRLYDNSPLEFLPNMNADHPYINMYNQKKIIFCIGQGAWEEGVGNLRKMENIFKEKGIHAWFDYWGYDVNHDWVWWNLQIRYFLNDILRK